VLLYVWYEWGWEREIVILTHAEVSDVFSVGHTPIAYFQHVEIVPAAGYSFRYDEGGFVHDVHD
jgi:hypothetical protein